MPRSYESAEMARRGRIGAHEQHARHDARETTRAGRQAFLDGFERKVDPDSCLPPDERQRRAEHALQAYMQRLGQSSARRRAARKQLTPLPDDGFRP